MEKTTYIIKPDGMKYRHEIKCAIVAAGLRITKSFVVVLPKWALVQLYPSVPPIMWQATVRQLTKSACEVGIITGKNAISKFSTIAGKYASPSKCDPNSIRSRFGKHRGKRIGRYFLYDNAIHRPKNHTEAIKDLEIIKRLTPKR